MTVPEIVTPSSADVRRVVTIVTSDWKGSTSIGERLDAESLREVQTRYFHEMRLVFEGHGGTIAKIIGDAIVAVFGLASHHENDPLRAVAAAAESLRTLASLNHQFEQTYGIRLVVRTGVATGEVVVGEAGSGEHVLTGETTRVATAMEQNAPADEVLLAPSTYEAVRELVSVEAIDIGSPPHPAYRLIAVSDDAERALREAEATEPQTAALAGGARIQERRKTVTIVFANPRVSVDGDGALEPAALREVMTRYFTAMRPILEKHGATVEKFIGDAVMAVFGLPVLHEDDALRASRAAIEMQGAMPGLNARLSAELGATVNQQIGVNTGEVIAGDASLGQRLVTGDAVNVAARLEQAAAPLEVLMGELTHRLVRDAVTVEPVEPLHLKGKSEAVPAYRLQSVSQAVEGFKRRQDAPMVGREAEMATLSEILLRAREDHAGRMATIVADAGTGKSRLIREFVDACDSTSIVLRGRCLPYGEGITFWPLIEAARAVAHIEPDDTPEQGVAKLAHLLDDRAVVDRIAAAIGLTRQQFGVPEIVWATRKMLESLAGDRTAIWVIDDIHWAEQTLLDLIVYLLEHSESPILLLCSSRPDLLEVHPDWALRADSVRLVLKPLTDADAAQVVHNLLGKAGISGDVEQRIVAAAEGNPLYVEQMLSMLIDSGRVRKVGDSWEPTVDLSQMAIPPTIQALLAARLDLLSQEERSVIEPASVIGMEFAEAAVEELSPTALKTGIPEHLQVMTRKQLVRRSTSKLEDAIFRFAHILIKDAAYGGLLKRARAQLHERFVTWADRVNRERGRSQEFEELNGYHLEQAYRYLAELGPIDEHGREVGARASDLLASAGRRAQARGDAPAAVNLLRRAAATRAVQDRQRLPLLPDLAQALRELGEFGDALQVVREARTAAHHLGDVRLEAKAHLIQLFIEQYSGETEDGRDWTTAVAEAVKKALPVFEQTGDEDGMALAWRLQAGIHVMANRFGEMADSLQEVVRHARISGDHRTETRSAYATAIALMNGPTPVDEAIARCEELEAHSESDQSAVAIIRSQLGQLHSMRGEFDRARTLCQSARTALEDFGNAVLAASTAIDSASIEIRARDYPAAERELQRAHDGLSAMGERFLLSTISGFLARVLTLQGRLDEAEPLLASVDEIAAPDDVDAQAMLRGVRARILAARGSMKEAEVLAHEAVSLRRQSDSPVDQGLALWDLSEIQHLAGNETDATASLNEALQLFKRKGDLALIACVQVAASVPAT